jgi:ribonuclease E
MTKRMLIDATHAEETRVVVLDGNRLEDFDVETSTKRQIKGNIYLAKIVRVEPSLQAAFVEYGGNRHGFLSFDEIHPDYYQIPVADRQRLLAMEAEDARREQEEDDRAAEREPARAHAPAEDDAAPAPAWNEPAGNEPAGQEASDHAAAGYAAAWNDAAGATDAAPRGDAPDLAADIPAGADPQGFVAADPSPVNPIAPTAPEAPERGPAEAPAGTPTETPAPSPAEAPAGTPAEAPAGTPAEIPPPGAEAGDATVDDDRDGSPRAQALAIRVDRRNGEAVTEDADDDEQIPEEPPPEMLGGENDTTDEPRPRRIPSRMLRSYKIQEVIHRRQILLVQVEKEERGTKGAALTTYISLAGRYCVLMPNSPRGGGISRKITAPADRRRLKEVMTELDLPDGMGLIVRTAGANRPKPEIKRDAEYLLRLWDDIREQTLKSVAPALIYEEASLIKRAIRDVYSRDIDEIAVDGEDAWRAARDFMRMLMPSHAKKVMLWHDPAAPPGTAGQPLFARHQVDAQLDAMLSPNVQLRSGGYLVINQAEALVAIDVNSGRSTRERGIEETALRTNLEAAEEVARQLRLRDLAGLIVIDFIDMESRRNNGLVEKRLKEALKADRARIQLGHISHFGLLEMSRQRLRPSLAETSLVVCAHCGGTGHMRSTESAAIHVLRAIEEEGAKRRAGEVLVHAAMPIVLYILNHKRDRLGEIEARHGLRVVFDGDDSLIPPQIRIEKQRPYSPPEIGTAITQETARASAAMPAPANIRGEPEADEPDAEPETAVATNTEPTEARAEAPVAADDSAEDEDRRRRRRRRRRRGGRREEGAVAGAAEEGGEPESADAGAMTEATVSFPAAEVSAEPGAEPADAPPDAEPTDAQMVAPNDGQKAEPIGGQMEGVPEHAEPAAVAAEDAESPARRRGRRGGRRRRREDDVLPSVAAPGAEQPDLPPVYAGPTPANPFGGHMFDIFDVLEQAEARAVAPPPAAMPPAAAVIATWAVTFGAKRLDPRRCCLHPAELARVGVGHIARRHHRIRPQPSQRRQVAAPIGAPRWLCRTIRPYLCQLRAVLPFPSQRLFAAANKSTWQVVRTRTGVRYPLGEPQTACAYTPPSGEQERVQRPAHIHPLLDRREVANPIPVQAQSHGQTRHRRKHDHHQVKQ